MNTHTVCPRCGKPGFKYAARCRSCGARLDATIEAPAVSTAPRRIPRVLAALGLMLLAVVSGFVWVTRARSVGRVVPSATRPPAPATPRSVRLVAQATVVPLAVDLATFEQLSRIDAARYGMDYKRLLKEGRVFEVPYRTAATIIDDQGERLQVRVELNDQPARVGWIARAWTEPPDGRPRWEPSLREGGSIDELGPTP